MFSCFDTTYRRVTDRQSETDKRHHRLCYAYASCGKNLQRCGVYLVNWTMLGDRPTRVTPPKQYPTASCNRGRTKTICRPSSCHSVQSKSVSQSPPPPDNSPLNLNRLKFKGNYSATSNNMKLVHWLLMGGLLHLATAKRGLGGVVARPGPSSLYQM